MDFLSEDMRVYYGEKKFEELKEKFVSKQAKKIKKAVKKNK